MNRLIYFLLLFVFTIALTSCEDKNAANKSPQEPVASIPIESIPWPPPPPEDETLVLSDNLITKNYYVILDGSGSMNIKDCSGGETKSTVAGKALSTFVNLVPKDANLGLLIFDYKGLSERVPLGINNRDNFIKQVNNVEPGSNTPLHDAINLSYEILLAQGSLQLGYGEYYIVVVTDGEASSGQDPRRLVNYILDKTPIVVYTIGFCIKENHSLNQPGHTIYKKADSPQELVEGLKGVLAEAQEFDVTNFNK